MRPPEPARGAGGGRLPRGPILGAGLGLATLLLHHRRPPHAPASLGDALLGTWGSASFAVVAVAAVALVGLLVVAASRRGTSPVGARVAAPLCLGLSAPLLAPFLHPVSFRCPAVGLALVGAAMGTIAAVGRLPAASGGPVALLGRRARARLLVAVVAGGLVAAMVPAWPGVTGDEPHYLTVAESLRTDGDLDVADDYAEGAAAAWHPDPLSPHYRPGSAAGSRYSMHGAGYAVLLTPILAAASPLGPAAMLLAARWFQGLLYAAFAAVLFGLLDRIAGRRAAVAGTLAATLTAPLLFAPLHLFPEAAAMLLACAAFAAGRRATSMSRLAVVGCAAAALPWLGVKYIPMAAVLAAMAVWRSVEVPLARRLAAVGAPLAIGWLGHAAFTWTLYGSPSPSAVYLGSDPAWTRQPGYGGDWLAYVADWRGWGRTLLGYLLDQKEGLLAVAPHWVLAAAGVPWLLRRRRADAVWLLLVLASHVGPYALSQQLGGQSPPVRPLMGALWAVAVPLGVGVTVAAGRALAAARGLLVGAGASLTAYLALNPELLPHDYPVDESWLLREVVPRGTELWRWAPSWVSFAEPAWGVTAAWTVAALALVTALARAAGRAEPADPEGHPRPDPAASGGPAAGVRACRVGAGLAVLLLGGGLTWSGATVPVTDRHVGARVLPGVQAWVARSLPERAWAEPGGVWVRPGAPREIVLTSREPLPALRLHLRVLVPTEVELQWVGSAWRRRLSPGRPAVVEWPATTPGYEAVPGRAWRLLLRAERGAAPADVEGGEDRRQLGAFLRLEPVAGG